MQLSGSVNRFVDNQCLRFQYQASVNNEISNVKIHFDLQAVCD